MLAASALGVALYDTPSPPPPPPSDGPSLKERVERVHKTLDVDEDDVIDVVEFADFVYIAEESWYISHEEAATFAYFILKLHHEKGAEISLKEAYDAIDDFVETSEFRPLALAMIRECLDLIEHIVFEHGTVKTFFEADTDDDYLLSKAELADAGLVRLLKDYDEDNDGSLDYWEYQDAVTG